MEKPPVLSQIYSREELNDSLNELLHNESFVNEYLRSELVAILRLVRQDTAREIFKEIEAELVTWEGFSQQTQHQAAIINKNWWQSLKSKYLEV